MVLAHTQVWVLVLLFFVWIGCTYPQVGRVYLLGLARVINRFYLVNGTKAICWYSNNFIRGRIPSVLYLVTSTYMVSEVH